MNTSKFNCLDFKSLNGDCSDLITARTLSDHATSVINEVEKVLAIAIKFLHADKNLPSGSTGEDLMNHVLGEMWKKEYASKNRIDPLAELAAPIPPRPAKWVFSGYLAYAYFGVPF